MNVLTEEIELADAEPIGEQYIAGEPFDHTTEHSDTYYEQYIEAFVPNRKKRLFYRFTKRSFDVVVSLLMLVVLSPILMIIAIAIKCDSKGSVIFKQKRIGRKGKAFNCYKFRSMRIDAPHDCATSRFWKIPNVIKHGSAAFCARHRLMSYLNYGVSWWAPCHSSAIDHWS